VVRERPRSIKDQLSDLHYEIAAGREFGKPELTPYIDHATLVTIARQKPPRNPIPTVSSFADWVIGLYYHGRNQSALRMGVEGEAIAASVRTLRTYAAGRRPARGWEIEFKDQNDAEPYVISRLRLNGKPLKAKPDRVLRHVRTGVRRIVEIKTTSSRVPAQGWPNMKVQLWCYGMIDAWAKAPKVLLMGEILLLRYGKLLHFHPTKPWDSKDPRIDAECAELFSLWGGQRVPQLGANAL
jgi:hypothetical protein